MAHPLDCDVRRPHAHGPIGVLLAHDPSSLGRIPEQILQRRWLQVCSILLLQHLAAGARLRVMINHAVLTQRWIQLFLSTY